MFFATVLLGLYSYYICPYNYENYFKPLILNHILNSKIKFDVNDYAFYTEKYINNSYFLDRYMLVTNESNSKQLADIKIVNKMDSTKQKLLNLFKQYPGLKPSVFVWEYSTSSGFEIDADEIYPSASIIKIPIAFELIRLIDRSANTDNPIKLSDKRLYTDFFKTIGSGDLQYRQEDVYYTLDYLAGIMIANSDNSATNMILYEIGGMDSFNRAMRLLGLKVTSMGQWLADIEGQNKITAREISKILYNIDNPNYINPKYKSILKEYLGNTKNVHLIKEKLPTDVMVLHKTGNIGEMLGDSGVVYSENGKKYIVTILVKRPKNDYRAKLLIQDASLIIYNDIKNLL